MSWRRLCSRLADPTAPRKYFVVTMLVALTDQKSGNSTPRCSGSRGDGHSHRGRRRVVGAGEAVDVRRLAVVVVRRRAAGRAARMSGPQLVDLGLEVGEGGERAVDRREAHVGHLVQLAQRG